MAKSITMKLNEDVKRAIAGMNPILKKLFTQIDDKLAGIRKSDVMGHYDLGVLIDKAMGDEKKYGENAAAKLAVAIGKPTDDLYRLRKVAKTWSKAEVEKLISRKSKQGHRTLTFGHLWLTAGCDRATTRLALLKTFFNEGTTIREFKALIQKKVGKRGGGKGRPRVAPKGPSAGLAAMTKKTCDWLESFDGWDSSIFENLGNKPGDFATTALVEGLETAIEENARLEEQVKSNKRKLTAALDATRKAIRSSKAKIPTTTPSRPKKKSSTPKASSNGAPKKKKKKKSAAARIAAARGAVGGHRKKTGKKKRRVVAA